jgi:phosphate-selective porin OprO/OprP
MTRDPYATSHQNRPCLTATIWMLPFFLFAAAVAHAQAVDHDPAAPCISTDTIDNAQSDVDDCLSAKEPGEPATTPEAKSPLPDENRQDLSIALSANVQNTSLLRQLLDGRHIVFFGRIEGEFAMYNIPFFSGQDGVEIRQFRAGWAGIPPWWKSISYKVEIGYTKGSVRPGDVYIQPDFSNGSALVLGNQGSSQSLNASTGSLSRLFMESPLPVLAFGLDNRLGASFDFHKHRGGGHVIAFTRSVTSNDSKRGMAARGYFNPARSNDGLWHLGASIFRQKIGDGIQVSSRPESHVTNIKLVDTGRLTDVDYETRFGIELAGATGTVTGRIEAMLADWQRSDGRHNRFAGAYIEAGFFPTGQAFRYRNGQFLRPQLDPGESAWEIALRLSWIDLNSDDVRGGEEHNAGLAINYYPAPNLRAQFNVIRVNSDQPDSDGWLIQGRLQFNW